MSLESFSNYRSELVEPRFYGGVCDGRAAEACRSTAPRQAARGPVEAALQVSAQGAAELVVRRQRGTQAFLKGPVCLEWLREASGLGVGAISVGLALWAKVGLEKNDFFKMKVGTSRPIEVRSDVKKLMRLDAPQVSRGLKALEKAGLIQVLKGGRGRCPTVVIVNRFRPEDSL